MSSRVVCAEAGLTARYFYECFENVDDLLSTLYTGIRVDADARMTEAIDAAGSAPRDQIKAVIGTIVDMVAEDAMLGQLAFVNRPGHPSLERLQRNALKALNRRICHLDRELYAQPRTAEGRHRVEHAVALVSSGAWGALERWCNGELDITRDEMVAFSCDLLFAVSDQIAHEET